jgi:hypothetical protein
MDQQNSKVHGNIIHTTTILSQARSRLAATSSGELVFFAGGENATGPSDRVDIYNVRSGSWTIATLSIPRYDLAATSSQNLVFFAGGRKEKEWPPKTVADRVDIYNTLNGSWSAATLSQPRCCLAATSVGNLVLFGGGCKSNGSTKVVDVFNVTNNTWTTATLSQARYYLAATSVDNRYALFGGGYNESSSSNVVDIFDSLSGMWSRATLSQARYGLAATSLGNLAFFGGGQTNGNQPSNVVDIFNSTSQTWSTTTLSQARYDLAASSIGEIVAFGGGWDGSFSVSSVVDMLNVTSNTWFTVNLSQPRYLLASASSTNKIFFGGGGYTSPMSSSGGLSTFIYGFGTSTSSSASLFRMASSTPSGLSDVVDILEIPLPKSISFDSIFIICLRINIVCCLFSSNYFCQNNLREYVTVKKINYFNLTHLQIHFSGPS